MKFRKSGVKPLAVLLSCVLLVTFLCSFYNIRITIDPAHRLLQENMSFPALPMINLNRAVGENRLPVPEKEDADDNFNNMLFLLGNIIVLSGAAGVFRRAMTAVPGIFRASPDKGGIVYTGYVRRLRQYLEKCLEFLSPLQKSISSLCDRYDIDPLYMVPGEKNPRSVFVQTAGFFIGL